MASESPRRVLSHSSIEAALRGAGVQDHPEVLAALAQAVGYDPRRPKLEYDWAVRDVLEEVIPRVLAWPGPREAQLYRLGRAMFAGWGETIVGRVLSAPLGQTGPEGALGIMLRILGMTPQFGAHVLARRGPRDFRITATNDPRHPAFVAGLVVAAVEVAGARDVLWEGRVTGFEQYELALRWAAEEPPGRLVAL
jgi:uncharacterized protein (TIGR02265 family)